MKPSRETVAQGHHGENLRNGKRAACRCKSSLCAEKGLKSWYNQAACLPTPGDAAMIKPAGIIIFADIEGSSGCVDRDGAKWINPAWIAACRDMTLDVLAVVEALASVGMRQVTVADFHRTGYNLFRDMLPDWVRLRQGYRAAPVPGFGTVPAADRAFFLGMHAAGGGPGKLAHTLTSRFVSLTVNGRPLAEIELFAASLGRWGISPALFSGCPVACEQARERIPGLAICPVPNRPMTEAAKIAWREELARAAMTAASSPLAAEASAGSVPVPPPYQPPGPFQVQYRWTGTGHDQSFMAPDHATLYDRLLRIAYYPTLPVRWLPLALRLQNVLGWVGLAYARRRWENP